MRKINLTYYRTQAKDEEASRRALGFEGGAISYFLTNDKTKSKLKWDQSFPLKYLLVKTGKMWGGVVLLRFHVKPMVNSVTWLSMDDTIPCSSFPNYWRLNNFQSCVGVDCILLHFKPMMIGKPGVDGVGCSSNSLVLVVCTIDLPPIYCAIFVYAGVTLSSNGIDNRTYMLELLY